MDKPVPSSGRLMDFGFPEILIGLLKTKSNGTLEVRSDRTVRKFFFKDGDVIAVSSNLQTENLAYMLYADGRLNKQEYNSVIEFQKKTGKKQGAALAETGHIKQAELAGLIRRQTENITAALISLDDGDFLFKEGIFNIEKPLRINPADLVYSGILSISNSKVLEKYCPPPGDLISFSVASEEIPFHSKNDERLRELFSLIKEKKKLNEIIEASPLPTEETLKHVCALKGIGAITAEESAALEADIPSEADLAESKRKHKRFNIECEILINSSIKCKAINLSEGGAFVHTDRVFKHGGIIGVSVLLDKKSLNMKARVQRVEEGVGIGVMFIDAMQWQKSSIKDYIADAIAESQEKTRNTVLLVDDSEQTRKLKKSRLVHDGFDVIEAEDGIMALKILNERPVGAVVLDLFMEKMDGFKVLASIRQTPEIKDLPVIILSGKSARDYIEKAKALGATDFLPKMTTSPVKLSEVLKKYIKDED